MSDFIDFERRGAQFWTSILEGERVPKIVTSPPKEQVEEDPAWFFLPVKDVLEASMPGDSTKRVIEPAAAVEPVTPVRLPRWHELLRDHRERGDPAL